MQFFVQKMIAAFRKRRRDYYLDKPSTYKTTYAFIGAGNHSIGNLYPCIQFLGIPVKIICTRNADNSARMATRFQGCRATTEINSIIYDTSITAVFLSVDPAEHFAIVKRLLEHGKHVFVEKPPCLRVEELRELIRLKNGAECVVGLQKRFSVVNHQLRKRLKHVLSYHYRYLTGAYPEGDPVIDLFIHPVDNIVDLFGPVISIELTKNRDGNDFHLLLMHENGVRGLLEMSTLYSWSDPVDQLEVNTTKETLKASYPNSLTGYVKPMEIMGVPLDKAFKQGGRIVDYVNNNGFIPIPENNSLNMQGFLGEIEHFASLVEKKETVNRSGLESLLPTFELLEKIKGG